MRSVKGPLVYIPGEEFYSTGPFTVRKRSNVKRFGEIFAFLGEKKSPKGTF
jgi:hypothetical protein